MVCNIAPRPALGYTSPPYLIESVLGDASSFVASGGAIRGPYLEASINALRASDPALDVSDMELATRLLLLSVSESLGESS